MRQGRVRHEVMDYVLGEENGEDVQKQPHVSYTCWREPPPHSLPCSARLLEVAQQEFVVEPGGQTVLTFRVQQEAHSLKHKCMSRQLTNVHGVRPSGFYVGTCCGYVDVWLGMGAGG